MSGLPSTNGPAGSLDTAGKVDRIVELSRWWLVLGEDGEAADWAVSQVLSRLEAAYRDAFGRDLQASFPVSGGVGRGCVA